MVIVFWAFKLPCLCLYLCQLHLEVGEGILSFFLRIQKAVVVLLAHLVDAKILAVVRLKFAV
jgi:hypothetical protein